MAATKTAPAPITEKMQEALKLVERGETDPTALDGRTVRSLRNRGLLGKTNKLKLTAAGKKALAAG